MYIHTYIHMHACMHACMHAWMDVCMYVSVHVPVYVRIRVSTLGLKPIRQRCVSIYIYTYINRVELFLVPFFLFGARFFCGWLVSARTVPLVQAVARKIKNC